MQEALGGQVGVWLPSGLPQSHQDSIPLLQRSKSCTSFMERPDRPQKSIPKADTHSSIIVFWICILSSVSLWLMLEEGPRLICCIDVWFLPWACACILRDATARGSEMQTSSRSSQAWKRKADNNTGQETSVGSPSMGGTDIWASY